MGNLRVFCILLALALCLLTACESSGVVSKETLEEQESQDDFSENQEQMQLPQEVEQPPAGSKEESALQGESTESTEENKEEAELETQEEEMAEVLSQQEAEERLLEYLSTLGTVVEAGTTEEYTLGLENELNVDGVSYYNFRVSRLLISETGAHQSYVGNYLVSQNDGSITQYDPEGTV